MRAMVVVMAMVMWMGSAVAEDKPIPPFAAMLPGSVEAAVVVLDYQDPAPAPKFGGPEAGQKLIAVKLGVGNGEDGETSVSPVFVEIQCADFAIRSAELMGAPKPELKSSKLKKAEDKVIGWVAFEIPTELNAADCKLNYGMVDKSDWIPLSAAAEKQPKDAPK